MQISNQIIISPVTLEYTITLNGAIIGDPFALDIALKEILERFVNKTEVKPKGPGKPSKKDSAKLLFQEHQQELPLLDKMLAETPEKEPRYPEKVTEASPEAATQVEATPPSDPTPAQDTSPVLDTPKGEAVSADDLIKAKNRRDLIRIIMAKGHTTLDAIVGVCTSLRDQVPALKSWSDIPTAVKVSYERVMAEDAPKAS